MIESVVQKGCTYKAIGAALKNELHEREFAVCQVEITIGNKSGQFYTHTLMFLFEVLSLHTFPATRFEALVS